MPSADQSNTLQQQKTTKNNKSQSCFITFVLTTGVRCLLVASLGGRFSLPLETDDLNEALNKSLNLWQRQMLVNLGCSAVDFYSPAIFTST